MKKSILLLLIVISTGVQAQEAKSSIKNIMHEQELAWNRGDLEGFMASYWKSDSLKFIGKSGLTYGWKNTLGNYKKSYPDKATMGTLSFTIISVEQLSDNCCYVIGKWHLNRAKDEVGGHYTLLWKKLDGKWVIVSDHSS